MNVRVVALRMGIAVPLMYFGVQLLAAPFYPGYSFLARDASTLGSPGSSLPAIFNVGALVIGVAAICASAGFLSALRHLKVGIAITWLTAAAIASGGLGSINAGLFPLPDPRHTNGLLAQLGVGLFFLPLLLPIAVWRLPRADAVRRYLIVNALMVVALVPVMSSLLQRVAMATGVDIPGYQFFLDHYQGLLQRIAAVVVFVPIGVVAWFLTGQVDRQELAGELTSAIQEVRQEFRQHLAEGLAATQRHVSMLHEDVIARIKIIGERHTRRPE